MNKIFFGVAIALAILSVEAQNKPSKAPQEIEIKETAAAEAQKVVTLVLVNSENYPISIAYSYNIDPKKTTGNVFPEERGKGRAKVALVIPAKTTITHTITPSLTVPLNLPLRITWTYKDSKGVQRDRTLDIMVKPHDTGYPISKVLTQNGTIMVGFSWDTYGEGGSPYIAPELI